MTREKKGTSHIDYVRQTNTASEGYTTRPHTSHTAQHISHVLLSHLRAPASPTFRRPAVAHLRIGTVMVRRTARRRGTRDAEQWGMLEGCCLTNHLT